MLFNLFLQYFDLFLVWWLLFIGIGRMILQHARSAFDLFICIFNPNKNKTIFLHRASPPPFPLRCEKNNKMYHIMIDRLNIFELLPSDVATNVWTNAVECEKKRRNQNRTQMRCMKMRTINYNYRQSTTRAIGVCFSFWFTKHAAINQSEGNTVIDSLGISDLNAPQIELARWGRVCGSWVAALMEWNGMMLIRMPSHFQRSAGTGEKLIRVTDEEFRKYCVGWKYILCSDNLFRKPIWHQRYSLLLLHLQQLNKSHFHSQIRSSLAHFGSKCGTPNWIGKRI